MSEQEACVHGGARVCEINSGPKQRFLDVLGPNPKMLCNNLFY